MNVTANFPSDSVSEASPRSHRPTPWARWQMPLKKPISKMAAGDHAGEGAGAAAEIGAAMPSWPRIFPGL